MLDLGTTDFVLSVSSLSERELRDRSSSLFDSWEAFVDVALSIPDYALFLQVEEGSIKGRATIAAAVSAVYFGIGAYGSFVSGLKTISEQVSATGDYVTEQASRLFSCPSTRTTSRKRGGSIASLRRLFVSVQKGELTPEEATIRAERLLGDEAKKEPEFMNKLADALNNCPRYHQQQPLDLIEEAEVFDPMFETVPKRPRPPKLPSTVLGPPRQIRVEVWRESKKDRKQIRTVEL